MTLLPTELLWLRTLTGNQCELKAVTLESRHRVEAMLEAELLVQIETEQGPVVCLGSRGRRLLRQPDSALPRQHRALTNLLQRRIGEYLRHSGYSFGHRSRNALVLESEGVQAILLIAQYEAPSFAALRRWADHHPNLPLLVAWTTVPPTTDARWVPPQIQIPLTPEATAKERLLRALALLRGRPDARS